MANPIDELINAIEDRANPSGKIDIRQTPEEIQKEIAEERQKAKERESDDAETSQKPPREGTSA